MDALTGTLAVLAFGFMAVTVYVVKLALETARDTARQTARLAEANTEVVSRSVRDAVEGIVEAIGKNFQGSSDNAAGSIDQPPEWSEDQLGGREGPPWMDWTMDDIPDEGRLEVGDPALDPIPGVPMPDLSGEQADV